MLILPEIPGEITPERNADKYAGLMKYSLPPSV